MSLYKRHFSHIYVEEEAYKYKLTNRIINSFNYAEVIKIKHYKDVFNRSHQVFTEQRKSLNLVIACNRGQLVYKGAPVCQDFGNDRFFYSSSILNCLYDCDYCFLKGMYSTGNIVIFVNFEDYEKAVCNLLDEGPLYVCASYDTDILAFNGLTGLADRWINLAEMNKDLSIELRTKSAPDSFTVLPNVIYAFSLLPDTIIQKYENGTAPLRKRIKSINAAIDCGAQVRLCIDPLLYIDNYETVYVEFCKELISSIDFRGIRDISIGTFRISKEYIKNLRRVTPFSPVTSYPFVNIDGYCSYKTELNERLIGIIKENLKGIIDESRVFTS